MSHFAELVFDDIETETKTGDPAKLIPRFTELFWSIECVGDRFPYGAIYDRRTGAKVGGWAHLPRVSIEEIL